MIAQSLTRRTVVVGAGAVGAVALTGCSVADLTTRKTVDPQAADRARLTQASDLSLQLHAAWSAINDAHGIKLIELHTQQIEEFERSGGLRTSALRPTPNSSATARTLIEREHQLATTLRSLALHAQAGDVAALLASAAAGIDQALTA